MSVRDLIAKLEGMDPHLEVWVEGGVVDDVEAVDYSDHECSGEWVELFVKAPAEEEYTS